MDNHRLCYELGRDGYRINTIINNNFYKVIFSSINRNNIYEISRTFPATMTIPEVELECASELLEWSKHG